MARAISKSVRVIDANCESKDKQAGADRYDFCVIKTRREKGRHREVVQMPGSYHVGTIFVGTYPEKAWRGEANELRKVKRVKLVIR